MTRVRADLLLVLAAAIWGLAFYFQKGAMAHVGPMLFLGLRAAVAAVALAPSVIRERSNTPDASRQVVRFALGGGLLFLLAGSLQQWGLITATVINTGFLTSLYVVATPLVVWAVKRRSPSRPVWLAVALAFAGAWALRGGSLGGFTWGDWLIAASALVWAGHIVLTGEAGRCGRPLLFTCLQFVLVAALALSLAVALEPIDLAGIGAAWESILFVGLLSSALTYSLLAVALRHTSASEAAVLLSLDTIFAAAAGVLLLGERLTALGWAGAGLILVAVLVVQARGQG